MVFDGYANYRIWDAVIGAGLNKSRSLGDLWLRERGVSCEPEILEYDLRDDDTTLFVCSAGIWTFIETSEAYDIALGFEPEQAMQAAEKLAKEAGATRNCGGGVPPPERGQSLPGERDILHSHTHLSEGVELRGD